MKTVRKVTILVFLAFTFATTSNLGGRVVQAADNCTTDNALFYSNTTYGSTCLDSTGWHTYTTNDPLRGYATQFAQCTDGSLLMTGLDSLYSYDKDVPKKVTALTGYVNGIACASANDVWVAYYQSLAHFDGKRWAVMDNKQDLGTSSDQDSISGVAIAPNKTVWAATTNGLASFDGKDWKAVDVKSNMPSNTSLYLTGAPAIDSKGTVYIANGRNIVTYDGSTIDTLQAESLKSIQALALDSKDNLYVGTGENGLFVYDGKNWKNYTTTDGLSTNNVLAVSVDATGRAWVATDWGLDVLDGDKIAVYTMSNSNLIDNQAKVLLATGNGPATPKPLTKKPGTVKGAIQINGTPLAGSRIQLCSQFTFLFSGSTPCGDMPDAQTETTDNKGTFEFDKVALGRYKLAFETDKKGWGQALGEAVEVREGKTTDLLTLKFTSK